MTKQRIHRKIERTPAEQERITAIRRKFQENRPSIDELVQSGDYSPPVSQGTYLETKYIAQMLRRMREAAHMSLTDVSELTGIDRSAISKMESGQNPNTTINTLNRIAKAYGKRFALHVEDAEDVVHK